MRRVVITLDFSPDIREDELDEAAHNIMKDLIGDYDIRAVKYCVRGFNSE